MQTVLKQYQSNLSRARDLIGLASAIAVQTTQAVDASDLYRASLVLAVSALDHFIHELTRKGMLAIASSAWPAPDAYYRFPVTLESVQTLIAQPHSSGWLEDEIRERHSWLSFQDPNKIAEAIRLISPKELWNEVGTRLGLSASDVKSHLKLIVDRRNKIAHEADMDPTAPGSRWPIHSAMATDALDFLEEVALAIYTVVTTP